MRPGPGLAVDRQQDVAQIVGLFLPTTTAVDTRAVASAGVRGRAAGEGTHRGQPLPVGCVDSVDRARYVWCGQYDDAGALVRNRLAFALAARLGCVEVTDRIGLFGDLLLAGVTDAGVLTDVPRAVVRAATNVGLLTPITFRGSVEPGVLRRVLAGLGAEAKADGLG